MAGTMIRVGAGFRVLHYGVNNSSGIFLGSTETAPTAGAAAGSGMERLAGAQTIPVQIPASTNLVVSGDDQPMVQFEFDPEELPNGVIEMAAMDNNFEALIQGTLVNTVGTMEIGVLDPKDRVSTPMCLMIGRVSKSWKSGERGSAKWENYFMPSVVIKPLGANVQQRSHNPYQYNITLSRSDRSGWTTINETENGTTGASILPIHSDNPVHLCRFTGNNAQTTFTLKYTPISATAMYVSLNGVKQAPTTNYTVVGDNVVFGVAPGTDVVIAVLYEYDEGDLA